jgi:hypothetical protein
VNSVKIVGFFAAVLVSGVAVFAIRGVAATAGQPEAHSEVPSATGETPDPHAGHTMTQPSPVAKSQPPPPPQPQPQPNVEKPAASKTVGTIDPVVLSDGTVDLRNSNCPVMGGKVAEGVTKVIDGAVVHFCCPGCDTTMADAPAKHFKKLGIDDIDAFKKSVTSKATK